MGRTVACLRVCADAQQGCRRYMEDFVDLRYEKDKNGNTIAFFAVFDGHGGKEAALFARNRFWTNLKRRPMFYSESPEKVCKTISDVFLETHESMWPHREKWPMTESGYVSTSGCTASVVVIKGSDVFVAHVGDSSVVLAEKKDNPTPDEPLHANMLTQDHQPQYMQERARIKLAGGTVEVKKGVTRVVWRRPSFPGQVATRNNSRYTNVPFLSVSRALGDLWSWNEEKREYIVSPTPDVLHFKLDLNRHKFLVVASDGVWNVFPPKLVVKKILQFDSENVGNNYNVAEKLVTNVICRCQVAGVRSDNTSAIVIFFEDKREAIAKERDNDGKIDVIDNVSADIHSSDDGDDNDDEVIFYDSNQEMDENSENQEFVTPSCKEVKPFHSVDQKTLNNENTNPAIQIDNIPDLLKQIPKSHDLINTPQQPFARSQPVNVALNEQTNISTTPVQFKQQNIVMKSGQKRRSEASEGVVSEDKSDQPASKVTKTEPRCHLEDPTGVKEAEACDEKTSSDKPDHNESDSSAENGAQNSDNANVSSPSRNSTESCIQTNRSTATTTTPPSASDSAMSSEEQNSQPDQTTLKSSPAIESTCPTSTNFENDSAKMSGKDDVEPRTTESKDNDRDSKTSKVCSSDTSAPTTSPNAAKETPVVTDTKDSAKTSDNSVKTESAITACTTYKVSAPKPKGPPSPGQKRAGDSSSEHDESFSTEHENSDPINCDLIDLQSAHVTGCNIQTTLVLEISDNKQEKIEPSPIMTPKVTTL